MCDHLSDLVFAENMKKHTAVLRPKLRERKSKTPGAGMSFSLHSLCWLADVDCYQDKYGIFISNS